MSKKPATAILAVAIALSPAVEAQVHVGPQLPVPARITIPRDGVTVLMQDMGGRPVVELKINGKGPYRFVLDTGAVTTVVSEELSRELSLTAPAGMQVAAASGGTPPAIVVINEIRIGDAALEDVIAAVMPLRGLLGGENAPRGVLSAANFPGYLLTYDYPGKRISIKKGAIESADSRSTFQYREEQVLPTVPLRIAGHDTEVHLDTGSGFGLTLPMKFLAELPLASQPKEGGTIELGKYKLDLDEVRFSDARPGSGPAAGNIGYDVLRHFVVTIDSKNRRIRLDQ
jgi:hypothetical protein